MPLVPSTMNNYKYVPPPRSETWDQHGSLDPSLSSSGRKDLILLKDQFIRAIESPRGEQGVFLESDGGPKPYRIHLSHTLHSSNLQACLYLPRSLCG